MFRCLFIIALALTALLAFPVLAAGITVAVDGQPVSFAGQQPVLMAGTVLVPLRGVFEKLGASVEYDAPAKRVTAAKGETTVVLVIGRDTAYINGNAKKLLLPASVMAGSTMVPLRFVSEALGAEVAWDRGRQAVEIVTAATGAGNLPPAPGSSEVTGRVTGVFPQLDPPLITVMIDGKNTQVPLAPDVIILVDLPSGQSVRMKLSDIRRGDQVTVRRGADGIGAVVTSSYGEATGTLKSIQPLANGNSLITLDDGTKVEMVADAPITMAGQSLSISDLQIGEKVVIRTNPQTKLAYGMAVTTGDQPAPTPPAAVKVTSFTVSPTGFIKLGDVISATMTGTSGGQAAFELPGVKGAEAVPMVEQPAGTYKGSFIVPAGISVKDAAALGTLRVGSVLAPTIQAAGTLTIDSVGPAISGMTPEDGVVVNDGRPLIYATISDPSSGIGDVSIKLDGEDVTAASTITPAFFNYRPEVALADGAHTAVVRVTDKAGNVTEQTVKFSVKQSTGVVKSVVVSPSGPYGIGDVITVTVTASPGGAATFTIGEAIGDITAKETASGKYTGSYTVKAGDSVQNAPLMVTFKPKTGAIVTAAASSSVTIDAGAPGTPTIVSPIAGAVVESPVVISGKARANSRVAVEVRYTGRLLVVPVQGKVASVEVKAGADGKWTTEPIDLAQSVGVSRVQYEAAAVSLDASGQKSEEAVVSFKKK